MSEQPNTKPRPTLSTLSLDKYSRLLEDDLSSTRPAPEVADQSVEEPAGEPADGPVEPEEDLEAPAEPAADVEPSQAVSGPRQPPAARPKQPVVSKRPSNSRPVVVVPRAVGTHLRLKDPSDQSDKKYPQTSVRTFPRALMEHLQQLVEPALAPGEQPPGAEALLVGFTVAMLGLQVDDLEERLPRAAEAARMFQANDPVQSQLHETRNALDEINSTLVSMNRRLRESEKRAARSETALSYLLAETTAAVNTANVTPSSMDFEQRAVLDAWENLDRSAQRILRAREDRENRS